MRSRCCWVKAAAHAARLQQAAQAYQQAKGLFTKESG